MKKVLLAGSALLGLAALSSTAQAELKLDLGGYFRGYGVYADQDEAAGVSQHEFEFRRDTEIHVNGETTLDNGLTVGFHNEFQIETNDLENESYVYFQGNWGRVNFGSEDGAAYLLQVAAPSADSNVDGLRQYIQALDDAAGTGLAAIDYDHADFAGSDRLTYLTPKVYGFQAGVSYAPTTGQQGGVVGMSSDISGGAVEDLIEGSLRWDGEFQGFGLSLGGGYSTASQEVEVAGEDDLETWNVGGNVSFAGFSVGGAYITTNNGVDTGADDADTWVVGAAWDNGPYHVGASYLDSSDFGAVAGTDVNRTTVGAGYTFGPGMTFRGAVAFGEYDALAAGVDNDFTQVTVGTDIQF